MFKMLFEFFRIALNPNSKEQDSPSERPHHRPLSKVPNCPSNPCNALRRACLRNTCAKCLIVVHSLELFAGSVPCRCLFLSSSPLLLCCFFLSLVPEVPQKNFIIEVPVVGGESLEKGCFGFLFQSALTDLHLPAFSGVEDVLS